MSPETRSSVVDQFYAAFTNNNLNLLARVVTEDFVVDLPVLLASPTTGSTCFGSRETGFRVLRSTSTRPRCAPRSLHKVRTPAPR